MTTVFDNGIKIDFKSLDIEEHAVKRAKERFKRKDRQDALNYFKTLLGASTYLGESTCEHGNKAHMFVATNKTTIYISLDCSKIVTAYKVNEKPYIVYPEKQNNDNKNNLINVKEENPLHEKLIKLYRIEFKKYDRMERRLERQHTEFKLKLEIQLLEQKLLLMKARSERNKQLYQSHITAIERQISESEGSLRKIQNDKRKISKALATLLSE